MLLNNEKQSTVYKTYASMPLTARPLDLLYFIFFAFHIPATLLVDLQYLYPSQYIPSFMSAGLDFYIGMSRDPLIGGIKGVFGDSTHLTWFKTFIVLEAVFQLPVFIIGLRGLLEGSRSIYPLLMLYGASSATTTLACLVTVIQTPIISSHVASTRAFMAGVTTEQRLLLLSSYIPFFIIPLMIAIDMGMRVSHLIRKAIEAEDEQKWK